MIDQGAADRHLVHEVTSPVSDNHPTNFAVQR